MTDPWNIPIFIHGYRLQKKLALPVLNSTMSTQENTK